MRKLVCPRGAVCTQVRRSERGGGLRCAGAADWLRGARAFGPEAVPYVRVSGAGVLLARAVARSCAAFMLRAKVNGGAEDGMRGAVMDGAMHKSIEPHGNHAKRKYATYNL